VFLINDVMFDSIATCSCFGHVAPSVAPGHVILKIKETKGKSEVRANK